MNCQQNSLTVPEYCNHHFCSTVFVWISWACWGMRVHPLFRLLFGLCIHKLYPSLITSHNSVKKSAPLFPVALKKHQDWSHSLSLMKVSQLFWYPPCTDLCLWKFDTKVVLGVCGNSSESSDIVKWCFPRTHWSTLWTSSSVTIEWRPWPPSSCTSVRPSLNFLHHSLTQLSLITLSPYTWHNRRWVSATFCPSAWRKWITAHTSQLAGAAMIVSMFHQWFLLHYTAKMYEGRCSANNKRCLLLLSVRFGAMTMYFFLPTNRRLILELPSYYKEKYNAIPDDWKKPIVFPI